jgi:hypothetical protein
MDYTELLKYPEFDIDAIREKFTVDSGTTNPAGEPIIIEPTFIFDTKVAFSYLILTYGPDSEFSNVKDMLERKELAFKKSKVPKQFQKKILKNENPMLGDMLTRFFREYEDFDYELLISAKEALVTLLEVVRKPIDSTLLDDKERNAVKAKRECFEDAKYIMAEIRMMLKDIGEMSEDAAEAVKKSTFKGGFAEKMAGN